ncbi:class I adenylate-forming enzyme family protein [Amycolatopsis sp. A133]|uniref:class I adenylate-forming enzyme family protein n=1 Tax=Amycolatopsis sp. A133 TaxID=3064472 RepID=UPI0027FA206D|nr:class I adenylate-forming enzyme family protein [Amycolatopsis sp. A133]MDQ7809143.1 class I adenylate-forming enzyme family protein [Amycolatopsis sp. A133]
MTGERQELAALLLAQGTRIDGVPLEEGESRLEVVGRGLAGAGVRPGDPVVLADLRGRDLLLAAVAAWRLDAVPAPVPMSSGGTAALAGACRVGTDLAVAPKVADAPALGLDGTAVLHLSSGSTGRPKVVKRGVGSLVVEADGYRVGLALVPEDRVAVPIPLAHSLGWGVAVSALVNGSSIEVTPLAGAGSVARRIDSGAVSVVAMTPPLARVLVATQRRGDGGLRTAVVGAGPVSGELADAFRTRFGVSPLRGYGSSETGGTFCGTEGIGRALPGVEVARPQPGETGELVLRLAAPLQGYLDSGEPPSHEWWTGDVVRREPGGTVRFVERIRGPLRLNGRFVDVSAMDVDLRSQPGVDDVHFLVVPRQSAPEIEDFFVVVAGSEVAEAALTDRVELVAAGLPVPRLVRCDRLPSTAIGKPDRDAMIALVRKDDAVA